MKTYKVIRVYKGTKRTHVLKNDLTLSDAQDHCSDPETSSATCTKKSALECTRRNGEWFDVYEEDNGRRWGGVNRRKGGMYDD